MREIKFRGMRISDGEWIYGDFFRNRGMAFIAADGIVKNPLAKWQDYHVYLETVGQYTGLRDKDGREIYEGDILREGETGNTLQVVYYAPEFCFKDNAYGYRFLNHAENFKVIGNIHDNPTLLMKGGAGQ